MRKTIIVVLALAGCDADSGTKAEDPSEIQVAFAPAFTRNERACVSLKVLDAERASVLDVASYCNGDDASGLVFACTPGTRYSVHAQVLSFEEADGTVIAPPGDCDGPSCETAADCVEGERVELKASFWDSLLVNTQGFFDIAVNVPTPPITPRDTCYTITIETGDPDTRWEKDEVCALTGANGGPGGYGIANGSITYIGTCDSNGPTNTVTVTADVIWDGEAPEGWTHPCADGCTQEVLCTRNADTRVDFPKP